MYLVKYLARWKKCRAVGQAVACTLLFGFCDILSFVPASAVQAGRGVQTIPSRGAAFQPYRRKIALVIGIDQYNSEIGKLEYAVKDAKAVGYLLETMFGFEVQYLLDEEAKKEAFLNAVISLSDRLGRDDQLLLFFAGHGATFGKDDEERAYLLLQDAAAETEDAAWNKGVSMGDLVDRLLKLPPKHILILLDACYSGFAAVKPRGAPQDRNPEQMLRSLTSRRGRHLLTAGKRGEVVVESQEWGHSAFVADLLVGLEKNRADQDRNGLIPVSELYSFLQPAVFRRTKGAQTPHFADFGSDQGEFVFIAKRNWQPALTKEGVRRKAIVTRPELSLYRSAYSEDASDGEFMGTYFIFEGEENGRLPVSSRETKSTPDAWLERGNFIEWNSLEVGLVSSLEYGERSIRLFADRDCAVRFVREESTAECSSYILHAPAAQSRMSGAVMIPLLERWREAYRGVVIPLLGTTNEPGEFKKSAALLEGWLPIRQGQRPLIREAVFMRRGKAKILNGITETLVFAAESGEKEGVDSFERQVNLSMSMIVGQEPDAEEPLDALLVKSSMLPFRTDALSFTLSEVRYWTPQDFKELYYLLEAKVNRLREYLDNPENAFRIEGNDDEFVLIPRELFP